MENNDIKKIRRVFLNYLYHASRLFGLDKKTISILCYHSISAKPDIYSINLKTFEKQIEKIARHAKFVSLSDILKYLNGKNLVGPAVAITFDDGYADVIKALPIIKKYKIPATIFVLADPKNADRKELNHNGKLLSWKQIKKLQKEGWTIGCHSATHADFSSLTDGQLEKEVVIAKKSLEKKLSLGINHFAYPKGFYDKRIISAVKNAGFKAAFAVDPINVTAATNRWSIPRIVIDCSYKPSDFPAIYSTAAILTRKIQLIFGRNQDQTKIRKPSILEIVIGGLITSMKPNQTKRIIIPDKVGEYSLISRVIKKYQVNNFGIGIYGYKGKKFFVKTWCGSLRDISYYSLINEYLVNRLMYEKLLSLKSEIKVPKLIDCIQSKNSVSVVFEYVKGNDISSLPFKKQKVFYGKIIGAFDKVTKDLTESERKQFTKRHFGFYLLSLPYLALVTIYTNPKLIGSVFKALRTCLGSAIFVSSSKLSIAHRDLLPEHIKISRDGIYVLDCENLVLTIPGYDLSDLTIRAYKFLRNASFLRRNNSNQYKFLESYISIHRAAGKVANRYTRYLNRVYV